MLILRELLEKVGILQIHTHKPFAVLSVQTDLITLVTEIGNCFSLGNFSKRVSQFANAFSASRPHIYIGELFLLRLFHDIQ